MPADSVVTPTVTHLPGGLAVVTEEIPTAASASVGIFVGAGARDEREGQVGASHFLEHLVFKGSAGLSAREVSLAFDAMGGDTNAFTTKEYTAFHARVLGDDLAAAFAMLAELVEAPALDEEDLELEREVIADELALAIEDADELCADELYEGLFVGHRMASSIIGSREQIAAMDRETVAGFHAEHYGAGNLVVSVAGAASHDQVLELVAASLGRRQGGRPTRTSPGTDYLPLRITARDAEQTHVFVSFRGPSRREEGRVAANLLNQVLGGGMSSRIFQSIREEHGWSYSVGSSFHAYTDTGLLTAAYATAPEHAEKAMAVVAGELAALAEAGPGDDELSVAKGALRAELLMAAEDVGWRMARNARGLLLDGSPRPIGGDLTDLGSATGEDVRTMAQSILAAPRTIAAVGPIDDGGAGLLEALG